MTSRIVVSIGNGRDLSDFAKEAGAKYKALEPRENPAALDLFRLHPAQLKFHQLLFVGQGKFTPLPSIFDNQKPGQIIREGFDLILVDRSCPYIFKPVAGEMSGREVYSLIDSRINGVSLGGVGTELAKIIFRDYRRRSCSLCKKTLTKMNENGIQWNIDTFEDRVDEIASNAKNTGIYFWRVFAKVGDATGQMRPRIEKALREAIENARAV